MLPSWAGMGSNSQPAQSKQNPNLSPKQFKSPDAEDASSGGEAAGAGEVAGIGAEVSELAPLALLA